MEIIKGVQDFPDLPTRMGKRPITIRGPIEMWSPFELIPLADPGRAGAPEPQIEVQQILQTPQPFLNQILYYVSKSLPRRRCGPAVTSAP